MFLTCMQMGRYVVRMKRDRWWKVQRLKEQARNYWYRTMRTRIGLMKIEIRRAYIHQTNARLVRPYVRNKLRNARLGAACSELDTSRYRFKSGLHKSGVALNNHMLTILSMYEPRSFEKLVELSERAQIERLHAKHVELPQRCFTKLPEK